MPRVSVIIPVFNGAATIRRALASVFSQSYTDYEVVVVDDGSTDDTPAMLASYGDKIHVLKQFNQGISAARNAAVRASNGEYLAFLDDDDEWDAEKFAHSVPILDADPDCSLVYTRALKVFISGRPDKSMDSQTRGVESPTMAQMLAQPWNVAPSQFMVRRSVFERCGGFDERFTAVCEDLHFLLLARECGHFRCAAETVLRKTTRPLFPRELERDPQYDLFIRLVRERYGSSAKGLIRELRHARAELLMYIGRALAREGRVEEARRCLARVIHHEPVSPRAYRRYIRTFFPTRSPRPTSRAGDEKI
jgi:glycosyltransferase involved in cell wall biosynthesis